MNSPIFPVRLRRAVAGTSKSIWAFVVSTVVVIFALLGYYLIHGRAEPVCDYKDDFEFARNFQVKYLSLLSGGKVKEFPFKKSKRSFPGDRGLVIGLSTLNDSLDLLLTNDVKRFYLQKVDGCFYLVGFWGYADLEMHTFGPLLSADASDIATR